MMTTSSSKGSITWDNAPVPKLKSISTGMDFQFRIGHRKIMSPCVSGSPGRARRYQRSIIVCQRPWLVDIDTRFPSPKLVDADLDWYGGQGFARAIEDV